MNYESIKRELKIKPIYECAVEQISYASSAPLSEVEGIDCARERKTNNKE
jgi:hypothetical protein